MNLLLSEEKSLVLINRIFTNNIGYSYDPQKHKMEIFEKKGADENKKVVYFRLPVKVPMPPVSADWKEKTLHYVILMIQSGQAALGYFEDQKNLDHKVFRAYMVRKKQGKSQIKYLKTKGKSRAGSRVRLAGTVEFFENINERLQEYFKMHEVDLIAMSCSKTLIPYLFNSKVASPFDKKDDRILKIPKHIPTPGYEELLEVQKFLWKGELTYEEDQKPFLDFLLG